MASVLRMDIIKIVIPAQAGIQDLLRTGFPLSRVKMMINVMCKFFSIIVILRPKAEESKIVILRSAQDDRNLHIAYIIYFYNCLPTSFINFISLARMCFMSAAL